MEEKMKKKSIIVLMIMIPVFLLSVVLNVKQDGTGDYTSISGAFYDEDMQSEGGIIYVSPGIYCAQYYYLPSSIEVDIDIIGINNETCIIDGNGSSNAMEIINVSSNFVIKNFTIEDGDYTGIKISSGSYGFSTIENCIITDCCNAAYPIYQKSGIVCHGNAIIQNNTFTGIENVWAYYAWQDYSIGGAIYIDFHTSSISNGYVQIMNNDFIDNFAADCGAIYATSNQKISVSNNYFEGNGVIESMYLQNLPKNCVIAAFEDCNSVSFYNNICYENAYLDIQGPNLEQHSLKFKDCAIAEIFNNTITQNLNSTEIEGINGIVIDATDDEGDYEIVNNAIYANLSGIVCSNNDYNSLTIDYNNVYDNPPYSNGSNNYCSVTAGSNDISSNPHLASNTFSPIWSSTTKSPCIDTGDPTITDADDTRSDIGAVCAIDHNYDLIELPDPSVDNGLKWLSFPSLDDVHSTSTYDPDKAGDLLFDILDPYEDSELEYVSHENDYFVWKEFGSWQGTEYIFSKTDGYIFQMNEAATLEISGFKVSDNTHIQLDGNSYENWIGYWLEENQTLSDAFGDEWENGNIYSIKHQDWSAYYSEGTWKYKTSYETDDPPTLSYADMVKVKCHNTISSFCWDNGTPGDSKSTFADPEYYSYEEQIDYIPLFIELDETDLPQEIGAFVSDECIGATVVESDLTQINAYTTSVNPGDIELELYYGSRSAMQNKTIATYKCVSSNDPEKIQQSLNTGENAEAWFVSLREDSSIIPSAIELTLTNYPNPFNPTTTISYNIPQDGKVSLEIYNIKGQHVRQLVSGSQPEGNYEVVWNGKDNIGKQVSSGIYYFRITVCGKTLNKKMLMLK
ncbi:MAG: hypothetical protein DRH79_05080 [Candidatus Cloacimonadota bacterium]|nr:MAG: hypothetical protein DRH79_05080 [Candidatus Cloacimonadota bacterium]